MNSARLELTTNNNVVLGQLPLNEKQVKDPDYMRHKKFEIIDKYGQKARPEQVLEVHLILPSKNRTQCENY